jgi:hypothetical protein
MLVVRPLGKVRETKALICWSAAAYMRGAERESEHGKNGTCSVGGDAATLIHISAWIW